MSIFKDITDKTYSKNIPLTALIELTHNCNLKCIHCYLENKPVFPKLNDLFIMLEKLQEAGTMFLTLTGGELFSYPDIWKFLKKCRKLGFGLSLFSNLQLLNKKNIEFLNNIGIIEIGTSVYSNEPIIHDKITGVSGSFNRTIENIKLLKKYNIKTVIKFILMKTNEHKFNDIKKFANKLNVCLQIDPVIVAKNNENDVFGKEFIGIEKAENILKKINENSELCYKFDETCGAAKNVIGIDPFGNVFGCLQWRENCGNIFKDDINIILKNLNKKYCTLYENMRYLNKENKKFNLISRCPALILKNKNK